MKHWLIMTAIVVAAGCNPSQKSFQVSVKNDSTTPVTLWLTKDGPPAEAGWMAPEQLAADPAHAHYDLAFVPPGKTGSTPKLSGQFPEGTHAVIRVYKGEKELYYILKDEKAGTGERIDYILKPGSNHLAVIDAPGGRIAVEKAK